MPWNLEKAEDGYYVVNSETGERKSRRPLSRKRATAQLQALYANAGPEEKTTKGGAGSGDWGHPGRPPHRGGSGAAGAGRGSAARRRRAAGFSNAGSSEKPSKGDKKPGKKVQRDQFGDEYQLGDRKANMAEMKKMPLAKLRKNQGIAKRQLAQATREITGGKSDFDWKKLSPDQNKRLSMLRQMVDDYTEAVDWVAFEKPNRKEVGYLDADVMVFKDKESGKYRWVAISSTAFRDRDDEIVSIKALQDDCERADQDGNYGPLRAWHIPGADIGDCDFNALFGRTLIESGTFRDERYALVVKKNARKTRMSIGFRHPAGEPDKDGVFYTIRRFERSILPRDMASNPYTGISVS
jgi:Tfp pilus assembly major pilin PilA